MKLNIYFFKVDSPAVEFGRRRRKIHGRRKSAEKNSTGHNPAVKM